MQKIKRVIIAGGKTGGHLFPGIAVAQGLMEKDPATQILFVGTRAPFETETLARYGFSHKSIVSKPIKGKNFIAKAWSAALVGVSLIQALAIIVTFRANFILGVGGFSSFALVLAGRLLFRQTAIHEQNAIPGMTNRMLAKIARTRFITFAKTKGMPEGDSTFLVGNPVRRPQTSDQSPNSNQAPNINQVTGTSESILNQVKEDDFLILVTGGSQGAASINKAFTEAMGMAVDTDHLFVVHQTGKSAEAKIQQFYAQSGIRHNAAAFFYEMPAIQDRADLVISRSGAGTVTELCIKAKPCILIPFPHAADDHQTANARHLADQGAAVLIHDRELTAEGLYQTIQQLRNDPDKCLAMAKALKQLALPHGVDLIAGFILGEPIPGKKSARKEDHVPA